MFFFSPEKNPYRFFDVEKTTICFFCGNNFTTFDTSTVIIIHISMKPDMKIVFLDAATMGDVSFEKISALGDFKSYDNSARQEALERVRDCEVLIINKIKVDKELIDAAPCLRLICEAATGVNNIDLEYAASKGIPVRNAAGYSTESVVQTTFMLILSLVGKCGYYDGFVKSGAYSGQGLFTNVDRMFFELKGRKMGIIGMGNIGSRVAKVAEAFGMEVSYFSTSGTSHCTDYPSIGLQELLASSDIVSIHAPLNDRTLNLIDAAELAMMKRSAYIINMGRGGIVNEEALARAIDEGTIAGAGLDVYTSEPLPSSSPLMNIARKERIIMLPHVGWASIEARERLVNIIAENISTSR